MRIKMITDINGFFSSLGLTKKETIVYIASLKAGSQTTSTISKKTNLPRSTVNFTFGELMKKGLALKEISEKTTYYSVIQPELLRQFIAGKEAATKAQLRCLKELAPVIDKMMNNLSSTPKIKYYEGVSGLQKTIDDSAERDEESFFISGHSNMHPQIRNYIEKSYIPAIKNHNRGIKIILNDSEKARQHIEKIRKARGTKPEDEVVFIDSGKWKFHLSTVVRGNKTSFVSYDPTDMTGIIIENRLIAEQMKTVFRSLLKFFKKNK